MSSPEEKREEREEKKREEKRARITSQFREAHNMTYELDCAGSPLILRMFPLPGDPPSEWRVEARTTNAEDAVVGTATAPSRAQALELVAEWWRANPALPTYDWAAIAQAMTAVRAI